VIPNSESNIAGVTGNSITTSFCDAQKTAFNDKNEFADHGGMAAMGKAFEAGMVLVMSLWDDYYANALWLIPTYPTDGDATSRVLRGGLVPTTSGVPSDVESADAAAYVFMRISSGERSIALLGQGRRFTSSPTSTCAR